MFLRRGWWWDAVCSLENLQISLAPSLPPRCPLVFLRGDRFYGVCCHVCVCAFAPGISRHPPQCRCRHLTFLSFFACEGGAAADPIHGSICVHLFLTCFRWQTKGFRCLATLHPWCCFFWWTVRAHNGSKPASFLTANHSTYREAARYSNKHHFFVVFLADCCIT